MLQNREGQRVPNVTFRVRDNNDWKDVSTAELFDGKTVAVFSLPGAFTPRARPPTCRASMNWRRLSSSTAWTPSCAYRSTTPS